MNLQLSIHLHELSLVLYNHISLYRWDQIMAYNVAESSFYVVVVYVPTHELRQLEHCVNIVYPCESSDDTTVFLVTVFLAAFEA